MTDQDALESNRDDAGFGSEIEMDKTPNEENDDGKERECYPLFLEGEEMSDLALRQYWLHVAKNYEAMIDKLFKENG